MLLHRTLPPIIGVAQSLDLILGGTFKEIDPITSATLMEATDDYDGLTPLLLAVQGKANVYMEYREEARDVVRTLLEVPGINLEASDEQGRGVEELAPPWLLALITEERERRAREAEEVRVRREVATRRAVEKVRIDMAKMLEAASTTGDFVLVGEGGEVACHTTMLVARCPALALGVLSTMREGTGCKWEVRKGGMSGELVGVDVVKSLLYFLYTGTLPEEGVEEVEELLEVSRMFELPGLMDAAKEAALGQARVGTALATLSTIAGYAEGEDAGVEP